MSAFDRLHPALQHHIVNSLGWRELRPVQNLSIDACLDGANLVILAPTAGGKTEAAFFPVISRMLAESWTGLTVLYVSPIRALLNNQQQRLQRYFELVGRRAACWHGDTGQGDKRRMAVEPPDCLLTTPESLEVILVSPKIEHRDFLSSSTSFTPSPETIVVGTCWRSSLASNGWRAGIFSASGCRRRWVTRSRCLAGSRRALAGHARSYRLNQRFGNRLRCSLISPAP